MISVFGGPKGEELSWKPRIRMWLRRSSLVNRCHKKKRAKGSEAGLPMRQVYPQVRSTLPTMLKFSKAL
jgi:hypothetical protein